MRLLLLLLCLEGVSAFAQLGSSGWGATLPALDWTLGYHRSQPSITSTIQGSRNGQYSLVDANADLGLGREGNPYGLFLEYKTGAHGFRVAYDSLNLMGNQALPRDIYLDGNLYPGGSTVQSTAKLTVLEGLYTYKFVQQPDAWAGIDLGVQSLKADLWAANLTAGSSPQTASPSLTLPQIGIAGGSSGVNGLLESRLFIHYFAHSGAAWYRYGLDGRAYLYPHFGLRAFYEANNVHIPAGSTQGNLDIRMDTRTYGLGLVARF